MRDRNLLFTAGAFAAGYLGYRAIRRAMIPYDFTDRVVVITGGSRGLGLLIGRELARKGARLAILARDDKEVARGVLDLASRGAEVLGVPCDVRMENDAQSAIEKILAKFGRIDVLINNAGTIGVGPIQHMTQADFADAMAVHFWAPLNLMQRVIPHMRARGEGRIVNISSIGGRIGVPHLAPYCASKFALAGLSEAMRAELVTDNIYVTSVYPGLMRTGSPYNAFFKGRHREEFAWFALMDSLPVTSIDARRAARQVVEACRCGDAQLTISIQAKLAVAIHALAPGFTLKAMEWMNRMLPGPTMEHGAEAYSGWDSRSAVVPSAWTRMTDRATFENNQAGGHASNAVRFDPPVAR